MSQFQSFRLMHPAHFEYLGGLSIVSLDELFSILDNLSEERRITFYGWLRGSIIQPRLREIITGEEKLTDLYLDDISYEAFKKKCYSIASVLDEHFFVYSMTIFALQNSFNNGNDSNVSKKSEEHKRSLSFMEDIVRFKRGGAPSDLLLTLLRSDSDDSEILLSASDEELNEIVSNLRQMAEDFPEKTRKNYADYQWICDNIIRQMNEINKEIGDL